MIGFWGGIPFVTFNAPGMKAAVDNSTANILKPQMMKRTARAIKERASDPVCGLNFFIPGIPSAHTMGRALVMLRERNGFNILEPAAGMEK